MVLSGDDPPPGFRFVDDETAYPTVSWSIDGQTVGGAELATWSPYNIADSVQDAMSERLHYGEPWPPCPATGTHPMNFDAPTGTWRCIEHGVEVPLGSLHSV
jgi:hypothetical protein